MSLKGDRLKDEGSRLQVTAAGATAGLVARFVIAPLDVVKIRLQLQTHSLSDPLSHRDLHGGPIYKGTLPTLRHILRSEGITGLWKGNVPAELLYVCYSAIQFTTYRTTTLLLHQTLGEGTLPPSAESFVAGAIGGGTATAATYPLDPAAHALRRPGQRSRVCESVARRGPDWVVRRAPVGFFGVWDRAWAQIIPYMSFFFATYETLRPHLSELELPFSSSSAVARTMASVMAKSRTFPLDLVRKRIQVQSPTRGRYVHKNIPEYYGGTVGALRTILQREGLRGLYRGLTVSLLKAAPASAVTMWTYERALKFYSGVGEKGEEQRL
uniref:Mitochondrial thiamine pyrophosphate carrier 1 n=1 Tax=Chaetomium globosum (strain ATCC 6205 / CBS 148.51 / DSM 1962 / NBRC 6347 / NRRL 1970) TaxID=306901 RepID=TPC1_CHAGB|nr:RecName: Full=Mitochondrial thiamine pyrophosphate carrier 1 [Chaetomium globosum CBS 148.51]